MCKKVTSILFGVLIIWQMNLSFTTAEVQDAKIKVGVIIPLSGSFARYGEEIKNTIIKASNNRLDLVFEDEGCDPLKTVSAYKKLSDLEKIKIYLGPWCGSPQMSIAPFIKQNKQIALLGSSAPEDIFKISNERIYSSQHTIESESRFNAEKMNDLQINNVVILFKENSFSRAHEKSFIQYFKGKISETIAYTNDDHSTIQSVALRLKQLSPQAVYVPDALPFLNGLLLELDRLELRDLKLFSVYSLQMPDTAILLKNSHKRVFYSFPDIGDHEAIELFPRNSVELLLKMTEICQDDTECILKELHKNNEFDRFGARKATFILKTISNGRFEPLA